MKYSFFIIIVVLIAGIIYFFGPIIKSEVEYGMDRSVGISYSVDNFETWSSERRISPININYSIVIPKINATAAIVDNVDPTNPEEYLTALEQGIAHAAGTAQPGEIGNVYLFSHAGDDILKLAHMNSQFYLLRHLERDDMIYIFFRGRTYKYKIYDKLIVNPQDLDFLASLTPGEKTLTLLSVYPPGTPFQRLVLLTNLTD